MPVAVEATPAEEAVQKPPEEEGKKSPGTHIDPEDNEQYAVCLAEELFPPNKDFDILGWWKLHGPKYPVLSCIARDVLAIQASTVASESSFSAGGRILTDHRSRLKSKMVEALICLQDWLKAADPKPINKDAEEEECLVFYQLSECDEETAAHKAKADMMEAIILK